MSKDFFGCSQLALQLLIQYRQSPAAFWVYSTVKVITVPAVTDATGNEVCVTTSSGISVSIIPFSAYSDSKTSWAAGTITRGIDYPGES